MVVDPHNQGSCKIPGVFYPGLMQVDRAGTEVCRKLDEAEEVIV